MKAITSGLQDLPNYKSYIAPGCNHTIFRFNELYTSTVDGVSFLDWLKGMTGGKDADKNNWHNLRCTTDGYCGEADLTPEGIGSCLSRTFGN